jgi:hypothetical protein
LRQLGYTVHTLESQYGEAAAPHVADVTWLAAAGLSGWVVLCKDKQVAVSKLEQQQIEASGAKVFCLTKGSLLGFQQNARILKYLPRIIELSRKPGPCVYGIFKGGVFKIWRPKPKPSEDHP